MRLLSIKIGLRRRWFRGLTSVFSAIGGLWVVAQIALFLYPHVAVVLQEKSFEATIVLVSISVFAFLKTIYEPMHLSFRVPTTETIIYLTYGDIFERKDDLLIAVNEYFDSALGDIVARNSVHGQFIVNYFDSNEQRFRAAVDAVLPTRTGTPKPRAIGPDTSYPVGTTAVLNVANQKAFLFVLTKTDPRTAKASCSVPQMWSAVESALLSVHDHGNGRPLALPLIGAGRSSLNLEPQHLLRLLVLALVDFARKKGLPKSVTIVLPIDCFDMLDIREIVRDWRVR